MTGTETLLDSRHWKRAAHFVTPRNGGLMFGVVPRIEFVKLAWTIAKRGHLFTAAKTARIALRSAARRSV